MNFDFVRIFIEYEILVRNMRGIGTNFSRAVRNWYQFFIV